MCFVIFVIGFIILCFLMEWYVFGVILICIIVFILISPLFECKNDDIDAKKFMELKRIEEKEKEQKQKIINEIIPNYHKDRDELIEKYGYPANSINLRLDDYDVNKEIIAFEETKKIWILGRLFPMSEILDCKIVDNGTIMKGDITSNRPFEFEQEDDITIHDYTVIINVDSLSDPIIKIHLDDDEETLHEIVGLMNVIIRRNRK